MWIFPCNSINETDTNGSTNVTHNVNAFHYFVIHTFHIFWMDGRKDQKYWTECEQYGYIPVLKSRPWLSTRYCKISPCSSRLSVSRSIATNSSTSVSAKFVSAFPRWRELPAPNRIFGTKQVGELEKQSFIHIPINIMIQKCWVPKCPLNPENCVFS